jgi:hypothetical protein
MSFEIKAPSHFMLPSSPEDMKHNQQVILAETLHKYLKMSETCLVDGKISFSECMARIMAAANLVEMLGCTDESWKDFGLSVKNGKFAGSLRN